MIKNANAKMDFMRQELNSVVNVTIHARHAQVPELLIVLLAQLFKIEL